MSDNLFYSLQAEQAVLGGLLLDNITWSGISDHLVSKDFYQLEHQILFEKITKKIKKGESVDALALSEEAKKVPELKEIKGDMYVLELIKKTPGTSNRSLCRYYKGTFKSSSVNRNKPTIKSLCDSSKHERNFSLARK